ncbi:MAG: hypothetical protein K5829_00075 [Treponema sp.]|nr:hypothetical protein [Treponema sp.]
MTTKIILLAILFIIAGASFVGAGIYFLSSAFLNKLIEASPDKSAESKGKNTFRAKGSGYTAIGLGALTIVWSIFTFVFPQAAATMGLVYLFILMLAVGLLIFIFK